YFLQRSRVFGPPNGSRVCLMSLFVFCCHAASADLGMRDTGKQRCYLANRPPLVLPSFPSLTKCLLVPLNPCFSFELARCCTVNASCKTKESASEGSHPHGVGYDSVKGLMYLES
ncbi:hypothetical protein GOODEAATRI_010337, partial [Goodea atripinnis]